LSNAEDGILYNIEGEGSSCLMAEKEVNNHTEGREVLPNS
jgi:hypothetical protein